MNFFNNKSNNPVGDKSDNFINPKVLEVNLVKDEVGVEFNWSKHLLSLFLVVFVAGLLVTEIYFGLDWWQKQEEDRTVTLNAEYQDTISKVKNISNNSKDFSVFKDKLTLTQQLADSHIYWTNFFNWLEKNTLNSVTYSGGFSGNVSGDYVLAATAKNFSDISWQVKAFKDNPMVESVSVDSGTLGGAESKATSTDGQVSFSIKLKVKPQIFFIQNE
jgi:hypothetical protein